MPRREWAAGKSTTLTALWGSDSQAINRDLSAQLATLRARAREQAQNSDHVRGFLGLVTANLVGRTGIMLQARAKMRNGRPDRRTNDAIEAVWQDWGRRGSCDVTGAHSWRSLQADCARSVARDGEALYRIYDGWDNRHGFAIEPIDVALLDIDYNTRKNDAGTYIDMGIERDRWHRPVAYHLIDEDETGTTGYRRPGTRRERVPAEQILHVYLPEFSAQRRGVPWLATSLQRIYMLSGYEDAELTASRLSAAKAGVYRRQPDAPEFPEGKNEAGDFVQEITPGHFEILPSGYDLVPWDPQHPKAQFGDFVKAALRSIATGLGVSYNTLANDLEDVNYSSLRQGAISERDLWMQLQEWLIEWFCAPVYARWFATQLRMGTLTYSNGRPIPPDRAAELGRVAWQPRRWQWVDPLKEVQAHREAVSLRVRSISDIIREQGRDPDEVWAELASDLGTLAELGIGPAEWEPGPAADPPDSE